MRYRSTIAFLAGALLFLLPFVEIKCNNEVLAKNTGLGLAIGSQFKVSTDMNIGDQTELNTTTTTKQDNKMYIVATAALGLGVLGFLLSLAGNRSLGALNGIIGFAAAACLLVLMFQVKSDIGAQLKNTADIGDNPFGQFTNSVKPVVVFTIWYYLSIAAFIIAAVLSFMKLPLKIPVNAPQVPINNPGDQSAFPGAPVNREDMK